LTVLPHQSSGVLQALHFDATRQMLISLVSTSQLHQLSLDTKLFPQTQIYKVICLPAVANHNGISLIVPKPTPQVNDTAQSLLSTTTATSSSVLLSMLQSLGGYVQADNELLMSAMMVPPCLMGTLYGILQNNRDWLIGHGVNQNDASYLVSKYYMNMMQDVAHRLSNPMAIDELIAEQTPGGLNEYGFNMSQTLGILDSYNHIQDAILRKVVAGSSNNIHNNHSTDY
jgi:pyrroline-5-carboxylate reductase